MGSKFIGVAGYMGAGKTTCSRILSECGFRVFDGDREARSVMIRDEDIHRRLSAVFGASVLVNGDINFQVLGRIVFGDHDKLLQLNAIVHPRLLERLHTMIFNGDEEAVMAVDAALIPLWNIDDWFDLRMWVHASREKRLRRLTEKLPELPAGEITGRMDLQERLFGPPSKDRWVYIENEGDRTALKALILECIGK